jgi:hypothetical protein
MSKRVVWKYEVDQPTPDAPAKVTTGAHPKLLHQDFQHEKPCIWVECDDEGEGTIELGNLPTGAEVPDGFKHLKTTLLLSDHLVLHTYYREE